MYIVGATWPLMPMNASYGDLAVECIPLGGTLVTGGDVVTVQCFLTTDIMRTYVAVLLDFACLLPAKGGAIGAVSSIGITVDPFHEPEPWFLWPKGGTWSINNQLCRVAQAPTAVPGQVTLPGGVTFYLATIRYHVSACASGNFDVDLENYSDPPHFTDSTRFMEYPGNINNVLPFTFTPTTLTVETGTCCQGGACVADDLNELCCSQTHPGASFFPGRSCEDIFPCGLCVSDAQCDDSDFCNGPEACDSSSGDCIPVTPPACDDGVFCNGQEICDPGAGCFAGPPPCAQGLECDEVRDECFFPGIPTVSTWGLGILALLVAIGAKVRFGQTAWKNSV
jgi:hypothetical protein